MGEGLGVVLFAQNYATLVSALTLDLTCGSSPSPSHSGVSSSPSGLIAPPYEGLSAASVFCSTVRSSAKSTSSVLAFLARPIADLSRSTIDGCGWKTNTTKSVDMAGGMRS